MADIKVTCLYNEASQVDTTLIGAKGWAVLVEADGQRTLFDTGLRGRYLKHNMACLDIEADSIDQVVISHGSMDHMGGLDQFMSLRTKKIDVYAHLSAWGVKRMFSKLISNENEGGVQRTYIEDWTQLSDHLWISAPVGAQANELLLVAVPDTVRGAVVITACSHEGLLKSLDAVKEKFGKIRAVVGGAHLPKVKQTQADEIAKAIVHQYGSPALYLNGCTTPEGIQKLRVSLSKDGVNDFYVGDELSF